MPGSVSPFTPSPQWLKRHQHVSTTATSRRCSTPKATAAPTSSRGSSAGVHRLLFLLRQECELDDVLLHPSPLGRVGLMHSAPPPGRPRGRPPSLEGEGKVGAQFLTP